MIQTALIPVFSGAPVGAIVETPEYGVILDCQDRQNRIGQKLKNWSRSGTCTVTTWKGKTIVGIASGTVDLTQSISLPVDGLYRVEIRVRRHPGDTGTLIFYDSTTQIDTVKQLYSRWEHYERIVYPVRHYDSGSHDFKITLTGPAYVEAIFIYPLFRYTAGAVNYEDSTGILDVHNIEFTMNSTNDIDSLNLNVGMENDYWDPQNDSLMVFGFTDHITVLLGENKTSLTPMYGGYLLGPVPSRDKNIVELQGFSRFGDMIRVPTYHDFAIGTAPSTEEGSYNQPYVTFSDVHTLGEYLVSTLEYPINPIGIPYNYGFVLNLADSGQYNSIDVTNLKKHLDLEMGHPAPSLKLLPDTEIGATECVLWENGDTWDAAEYPMFNMDYHVSGAGARYPLEVDLCFTMHKSGETLSNALDYIVRFTGTMAQSRVIGGYQLDTYRDWPSLNFNLKSLFDVAVGNSEYNISKVSLVGALTQSNLDRPICSALWVDNVYSYGTAIQAPKHTSNGVNYPFDELQGLCTETDHIAYIRPGLERRDDVFVIKPLITAITDEVLQEGLGGNVLDLENWSYDPIGNEFCNQAHSTFNFSDGTNGSSYQENWDSIIDNGPWENHQFLDDVKTQADADGITIKYLQNHCIEKPAFTVPIQGSTLIEPAHYILANIISSRVTGYHQIKAITQRLDIESESYTTDVDINQPSLRFKYKVNRLNKILRGDNNNRAITRYREASINGTAKNSPGAFLRV